MSTSADELARIRCLLEQAHISGQADEELDEGLDEGLDEVVDDVATEALAALEQLGIEDQVEHHNNPDTSGTGELEADDDGMLFVESFRNVTSVPRGFSRGRKRPRSLSTVNTVLIHQTAVAGGFAVSDRLLDRYQGQEIAARQARYRDTPYHGIYSPIDRASIVQWPAWVYSFHGNGGNRYSVDWAYDGKLPGDVLDLYGARSALRHFVIAMREVGVELRYIEGHRQHSDQRGGDPGLGIWSLIVRPLLEELGLEERAEHTTGSGLTLPDAWRV